MEIVPLNLDFDNENRKELTYSIDEIDFSNTVFMIIDKKTELEVKQLKDYPEWDFPEDDLRYKTIEIYSDLKDAKEIVKPKGNQNSKP